MNQIKTINIKNIINNLSPELAAEINNVLATYYDAGAEDMKQAALKACLKLARAESYYSDNLADECAEEIQKINLKEEK